MRVIDSHTEGEPTRVIIDGGPQLGCSPLAERAQRFAGEFASYRSAAISEPRGHDGLVGALLCEPCDETCAAGAIFFNNAGLLGMCGHAMIGTAVTLAHLGRIELGRHRFETPAGMVTVNLNNANEATLENVESFRYRRNVQVVVDGIGTVTGDVAYGGNWFFLTGDVPCPLEMKAIPQLSKAAGAIRRTLAVCGVTGAAGAGIDHVEFFGAPHSPDAHSRNFVLCPGGAYDRSPCGTGTSAKLACLAADGLLEPGETWVQESIIGSRFAASYQLSNGHKIRPSLTGRAYICSEATLYRDPQDPFADGIVAVNHSVPSLPYHASTHAQQLVAEQF
ncbi:MAG: proline racemase family protein [Anderseniella sp.]